MMDARRARELLERERERLAAMRREADGHLADSQEESSGELTTFDQHPGDVGTETLEREQDESLRDHADAGLAAVDAALARLEAGEYGRCEVCDADIPEERLELLPQTRYCVEHQRERERDRAADRQSRV